MRFLPTLDLWDPGIHAAVWFGRLKLQCGQWVKCGKDGAPARWVCMKPYSMWVAHSEGEHKTSRSFPRLCIAAGLGKTKDMTVEERRAILAA